MVSRVLIVAPFFSTLSLAILHLWRLCGVLHEICNRSDLESAKRELIIIMANLFGHLRTIAVLKSYRLALVTLILFRAWENRFDLSLRMRCFRVYPLHFHLPCALPLLTSTWKFSYIIHLNLQGHVSLTTGRSWYLHQSKPSLKRQDGNDSGPYLAGQVFSPIHHGLHLATQQLSKLHPTMKPFGINPESAWIPEAQQSPIRWWAAH